MPRRNDDEDNDDDRPRKPRRDEDDDAFEEDRPRSSKPKRPRDDDDEEDDRPIRKGNKFDRSTLRSIAIFQKVLLVCILVYVLAVVAQYFIPPELRIILGLGVAIPVILAATVFVFLLATKVYSPGVGVLLGILTLIPCVGLIVLLVINGQATAVLRQHGISVGLLGASLSDID